MGIFSDLKKLVFGAESIGKSAVNKGKEYAKETSEELLDRASDIGGDLRGKAESIGGDLMDKAGALGDNVAEKTSGLRDAILHQAEGTINMVSKNETLKNVAEKTERIGESLLEKGEELINKGSEKVEQLGNVILGENNENLEKAKEFTESVGSKVMETKDKLVEKGKELAEDINEKIDETLDRAKAEDAAEAAAPPQKDLKEILDENEGSLLKDKDDFFSKAEKFADGDYQAVNEGKITIQKVDIDTSKEPAKAAGFDDLDGDGNELIDDAEIVE